MSLTPNPFSTNPYNSPFSSLSSPYSGGSISISGLDSPNGISQTHRIDSSGYVNISGLDLASGISQSFRVDSSGYVTIPGIYTKDGISKTYRANPY